MNPAAHDLIKCMPPLELTLDLRPHAGTEIINTPCPLFGWAGADGYPASRQTAFRILVAGSLKTLSDGAGDCWDSGKVESAQQQALYGGSPLQAHKTCYWTVCVWNERRERSPFVEPKSFVTASLAPEDDLRCSQARVEYTPERPMIMQTRDDRAVFADFALDAYGILELTLECRQAMEVTVALGEVVDENGRLVEPAARSPACNRRFRRLRLPVAPGIHTYRTVLPAPVFGDDYQQAGYDCTGKYAVRCPEHLGEFMPFRYCEITSPAGLPPVCVRRCVRLTAIYPFNDRAAEFVSSDQSLNRVWSFCKHSIKASNAFGIYIDGDRERAPYEGDALVNQLGHYCCDWDYSLARVTFRHLTRMTTWPFEYSFCKIFMAWYDYLYTGDKRLIADYYGLLNHYLLYDIKREDGLLVTGDIRSPHVLFEKINNRGNLFRDLIDWPPFYRDGYEIGKVNTVVNAYHYRALVLMARIAAALGKIKDADQYRAEAERVKTAILKTLFCRATGLFVDSELSRHSALHANMYPLAFGLCEPAIKDGILKFIRSKGMACSVFAAQFLLEAIAGAGEEDLLQELITDKEKHGWLSMLDEGATITMESWNDEGKDNSDWTHPWGAAPANIIPRFIMGIRPLEPGFSRTLIQPLPGHLGAASFSHPTVLGIIRMSFHNRPGEFFAMNVGLPAGMTAEVRLPPQVLAMAEQGKNDNRNQQLYHLSGNTRIIVSRTGGLTIE